MFRGSSHCSTSPPSHRKIFTISSTGTQGTSTEDLGNTIWEYITTLSNNNLHTRGKAQQLSPLHLEGWALSQNNNQPLTRGIRLKANTPTTIISTLREIPSQPSQLPLHLEGYQPNQTISSH